MNYFIVTLLLAFLIEIFLDTKAVPFYFRHGILLFRKRFKIATPAFTFPDMTILNEKFDEALKQPSLIFDEIGPSQIAVREKPFQITFARYSAILHGNIEFDGNKKELILSCYSNLTISVLILGLTIGGFPALKSEILNIGSYGNIFVNILFFLFVAFCIATIPVGIAMYQVHRFKNVVNFLIECQAKSST